MSCIALQSLAKEDPSTTCNMLSCKWGGRGSSSGMSGAPTCNHFLPTMAASHTAEKVGVGQHIGLFFSQCCTAYEMA